MKTLKENITRGLLIFSLLASLSSSLAQTISTGDILVQKKTADGHVLVPLTPTANKVLGFDGSSVFGLQTAGVAWGSITGTLSSQSDLNSALAGKQPLDSDLTSIAALTTTSFGRGLLTLADAAALRTSAGLGSAALKTADTTGTSTGGENDGQVPVYKNVSELWSGVFKAQKGTGLFYTTLSGDSIQWFDKTTGFHIDLAPPVGSIDADAYVRWPASFTQHEVTVLGNVYNDVNGLVMLNGSLQLPAVDGSQLTGLTVSQIDFTGGVFGIANGGTGQTTAANAINALMPTQSGNGGKFLTTDGSAVSWGTVSLSPGGSSGQVQYNSSGSFAGSSGLTFDATNKALTLGGATVTTSNPVINATQTWNAGGVTFTAIKLNVTNTASASGSLLLDLQLGGTSMLNLDKSGVLRLTSTAGWLLYAGGIGVNFDNGNGSFTVANGGNGNAIFVGNYQYFGINQVLRFYPSYGNTTPSAYIDGATANTVKVVNSTTQQKLQVYGTTTGSKYAELTHNGTNMILTDSNSGAIWRTGAGSPEGSVTAPVGSLYTRTDGGASTTLYVKESGSGNTGWVAK